MRLFPLLLMMPVAGCVTGSLEALCDATRQDRARAASVVAAEGSDNVVLAVQPLIAKTDAACR